MGCWNGSCMISGLPIQEGEKAVAIPMVIHPNGELTVTFFPIHGEYNDGGSLMNVESNEYSARLVELVLEAGSHKKKKSTPAFDPADKKAAGEIGKRLSEGKEVSKEDKDMFLNYIRARARESSKDWDTPAFWFGGQWEYSFEKGKDIQDEADLLQIMEREFVRGSTFQVHHQGKWLPVIINLIHGDVWDAFKISEDTRFLQEHSLMKLYKKLDDSDMLPGHLAKAIFESIERSGYGYKYTPLFGIDLFGDVLSVVMDDSKKYPQPLLDLYQLGSMLFSLRRELCTPALAGSQSACYGDVKKLAEAMIHVVDKHQNFEE